MTQSAPRGETVAPCERKRDPASVFEVHRRQYQNAVRDGDSLIELRTKLPYDFLSNSIIFTMRTPLTDDRPLREELASRPRRRKDKVAVEIRCLAAANYLIHRASACCSADR